MTARPFNWIALADRETARAACVGSIRPSTGDSMYNPGLETLRALRANAVERHDDEAVARLDGKIEEIESRAQHRRLTVASVRRDLMQMPGFVPASGVIRHREEDH